MKGALGNHSSMRFILPVMLENILNNVIGMVFSYLIGGISSSSLTTIALGNQVITFITAFTTLLTTGSGILCSRLLGADERLDASRVVEQTLLLTGASGIIITALFLVFSDPIMRLLMPGADAVVLREGTDFFRVLILSLPFLLAINSVGSVLRSTGDGRSPFVVSIVVCATQLLFSVLFLRVFNMEVIGAGLTYLLCRICGAAMAMWLLLRCHDYVLHLGNLLRPHIATFKRILSVGVPTSIESIFVQTGYLVANSMVIGLGTFEAAVFNVANTLWTFATLPQSITSAIAMTLIGQLIGAKEYSRARRTGWKIFIVAMSVSLAITIVMTLCADRLTPIYSSDPAIQQRSADTLAHILILLAIPALTLNALDPQLRVGGDVRYVMYSTIIAVWLIRLPLTYLFCYVWSWGAEGVFWANTLSLTFRMICNTARFIKGKYLYMRV